MKRRGKGANSQPKNTDDVSDSEGLQEAVAGRRRPKKESSPEFILQDVPKLSSAEIISVKKKKTKGSDPEADEIPQISRPKGKPILSASNWRSKSRKTQLVRRPSQRRRKNAAVDADELEEYVNFTEQIVENVQKEYPEQVKRFSGTFINGFGGAAEILLCRQEMPAEVVSTAVPDHAPMTCRLLTFLVDTWTLDDPTDIYYDSHGSWGPVLKVRQFYCYDDSEESAHRVDPKWEVEGKFDAVVLKSRYRHLNANKKLIKHIFTVYDPEGNLGRYALISYKWMDRVDPFEFHPGPLPIRKGRGNFNETSLRISMASSFASHEDFQVDGVNIFLPRSIATFQKALEILLKDSLPSDKVCMVVPPRAPQKLKEVSFVVDLSGLEDFSGLYSDEHGWWGRSSGDRAYFVLVNGRLKKCVGYDQTRSYDVKVTKIRWRHPNSRGRLVKHVYTAKDRDGGWFRYGLICYKWDGVTPFEFAPGVEGEIQNEEGKKQLKLQTTGEPDLEKLSKIYKRYMEKSEYEERLKQLRHGVGEPKWNVDVEEMDQYPPGVEPFSARAITGFQDVADILLRMCPVEPVCTEILAGAPVKQSEVTFVVDLAALESPGLVYMDCHGAWGRYHTEKTYYHCTDEVLEDLGRDEPQSEYTAKIIKCRFRHPNTREKLKKYLFTCRDRRDRLYRWAVVSYKWDCKPYIFQPGKMARNVDLKLNSNKPGSKKKRKTLPKLIETVNENQYEEEEEEVEEESESDEDDSGFSGRNKVDEEEEEDVIHPEETFPPGVIPLSSKVFSRIPDAAEVMLKRDPTGPISTTVPLRAPTVMRKVSYLVDLQALDDPRDIFVDLHGVWGSCSGQNAYYKYTPYGVRKVDANGKIRGPDKSFDVKMTKYRYNHKGADDQLRKYVFFAQTPKADYLRWAIVSYQWFTDPFVFEPTPHGNSTKNLRPFLTRKPSVRNKIRELSMFHLPREAVVQYMEGVEQETMAPQEVPRDSKQASNSATFPRRVHRAADEIANNADLIRQFPSNENVFSVMDETLGKTSVFSYTVTRLCEGEYACICEEFESCQICRHSLAVAKLHREDKNFIEAVATRMCAKEVKSEQVVEEISLDTSDVAVLDRKVDRNEWNVDDMPDDEEEDDEKWQGEIRLGRRRIVFQK